MIYPHQQRAIDYITGKFKTDPDVHALIISGSIAHGLNNAQSDVDINIIVSNDFYEQKNNAGDLTYWETAADFYDEGYFDGKYITLDYLDLVSKQGNEPTRFALHDSIIAFDKTGQVSDYIKKIGMYNEEKAQENTIRFLSQLEAWKWYSTEALKRQNRYLLDTSVSKLILFSGRLILLDNKMFFPYHKWFMKSLENAPQKPHDLMNTIDKLLNCKSEENINALYQMIKDHRNWANGLKFRWGSYFLHDIETVWMREEEFIENL